MTIPDPEILQKSEVPDLTGSAILSKTLMLLVSVRTIYYICTVYSDSPMKLNYHHAYGKMHTV
jgi:hypothetical protein